ncbi:hypothetical protein MRX96_050556 [Rhipicephalus microplus]
MSLGVTLSRIHLAATPAAATGHAHLIKAKRPVHECVATAARHQFYETRPRPCCRRDGKITPTIMASVFAPPVLKPRSPARTTSRTPSYWDNAAEREPVDEHATLPEPKPLMDAGENGSESNHDGSDSEQAASSSPETSSAETSRESWVVSLSEGEEQKVPHHETGEELAELLVDEAHFPPLDVVNAPPRDTSIRPRVGSDHARTPNPLQPVVNPSPADTTPPAGPANEAYEAFLRTRRSPLTGAVTARAHARLGRRTGQRIRDRSYLRALKMYIADRPLSVSSSDSDAPPRANSQRLARTAHG